MSFKNMAIVAEKVVVALAGALFIAVLGAITLVDAWLISWIRGG
jgi:hypothetical protein